MKPTCYLCRRLIEEDSPSGDHVVPKVLISRSQPKAKGFDYAGELPTHPECNNRFGPESYCTQALEMIDLLTSEEPGLEIPSPHDPTTGILALDASKLPSFTNKDLVFFKITDVRETGPESLSDPAFFSDKQKTNPIRDALYVFLSVLTKSAAALLVKRKLSEIPTSWHIYAAPYSGATDGLDFVGLLKGSKPFDVGVQVWLCPLDANDWIAIYRKGTMLVFLVFVFSQHKALARLKEIFPDADILEFRGTALNQLLTQGWHAV